MSCKTDISDAVYRENEQYIRKLCSYKLKNLPSEIDDCVQEVFIAFVEAVEGGKEIKNPKAWLTVVANNMIKDIYEKNSKRKERIEYLNDDTVCGIEYDIDNDFDETQVLLYKEKIISLLTDDERSLLYERYVLKLDAAVIAEKRNTTRNNIFQKISRLKIKTKMLIKKVLNEQNI